MSLDCSNCKAYCCKKIGLLNRSLDRGDGACRYLTEDNKCKIYQDRPLICNTDRMYNLIYKDMYTPEQWTEINLKSCRKLRDEAEKAESTRSEDQIQENQEMEGSERQGTQTTESRPNY